MSTTKTKRAGKAVADASRKQRSTARDEAKAKKLAQEMAKTPAGKTMKIDVSVNGSAFQSPDEKALQDHRQKVLLDALEVLCTEDICTISLLQRRLHIGYSAANELINRLVSERYADWVEKGGCKATAETMENWNNAGKEMGIAETRTTDKSDASRQPLLLKAIDSLCSVDTLEPSVLEGRYGVSRAEATGLIDLLCALGHATPEGNGCRATAATMEAFRASKRASRQKETTATVQLSGGPAVPMDDVEAAVAGKPSTPEARQFVEGVKEMVGGVAKASDADAKAERASVLLSIPTDIGKVASDDAGGRYAIGDVAVVSTPDTGRTFLLATNGWMLACADCQQITEGPILEEGVEAIWVPKDFARTDGKNAGEITLRRGNKRDLFDSGLFWVRVKDGTPIGKFAAQPTGIQFPAVSHLFRSVDDDLQFAVDAEDLALLAKAVNGVGAPGRSVVVLSVSRSKSNESVMVIGDSGMAVLMPKEASIGQYVAGYRSRRAGVIGAAASASVVMKKTSGAGDEGKLFDPEHDDDEL